jgi:hypothetical protein
LALEDEAFGAAAVEFGVVDSFPGAKVELAARDGHDDLVAENHPLEVGVAVVFAGLMVPVASTSTL